MAFRVFRAACKYWVHSTSSIPVNDAKASLDIVSIYMVNVEPDEGFFLPTRSGTLPGPGDMGPRTFSYQTFPYQTHIYQTFTYLDIFLPRLLPTLDKCLPRHFPT